ncbi:hypothetical protein AB0M29_10955 [Streptomyces sp. NPDC051976]|uniref:hypothetical protein n=1 Tax=Streptomyces sp. NPDC051976 TaxID=3154947 RepID=UPI00341EC79B
MSRVPGSESAEFTALPSPVPGWVEVDESHLMYVRAEWISSGRPAKDELGRWCYMWRDHLAAGQSGRTAPA